MVANNATDDVRTDAFNRTLSLALRAAAITYDGHQKTGHNPTPGHLAHKMESSAMKAARMILADDDGLIVQAIREHIDAILFDLEADVDDRMTARTLHQAAADLGERGGL